MLPDQALDQLAASDPLLGKIIAAVGPYGLEPKRNVEPYEMLIRSIAYQQLSGKAAKTILDRFLKLFPGSFPQPQEILRKRPETLRKCGLSNSKVLSIRDIAAKTIAGVVPSLNQVEAFSEDDLIVRLTEVRGVGIWTAQMYLMFGLGRLDVLPANDYGIQKGFQKVFGTRSLPTPDLILKRGRKWAPYRTVASWYLWRSLELMENQAENCASI